MITTAVKASFAGFALIVFSFTGCFDVSSDESLGVESRNSGALALSTPEPPTLPTPVNSKDLDPLRRFAEAYEPRSGGVVIPSPPVLDQNLSEIIARTAKSDSREHERYVLLIFLKISRFQIENFKQRYELGRENPLTKEFYRLIGENNYEKAEIMLAHLADNYVGKTPLLLQYEPIKAEMARIEKAGARIEMELRRTEAKQSKPKK